MPALRRLLHFVMFFVLDLVCDWQTYFFITPLQKLRLDGAFTLLGERETAALPAAQTDLVAHLQAIIDGLCDLSLRDPLTGTANRRHFDSILDRELDRGCPVRRYRFAADGGY